MELVPLNEGNFSTFVGRGASWSHDLDLSSLLFFCRDLDAFIYDATVLEYLVAQDEECKLLTVGAWAAMTGYGAAFPRNSKHFHNFNRKIMDFSENGKYSIGEVQEHQVYIELVHKPF